MTFHHALNVPRERKHEATCSFREVLQLPQKDVSCDLKNKVTPRTGRQPTHSLVVLEVLEARGELWMPTVEKYPPCLNSSDLVAGMKSRPLGRLWMRKTKKHGTQTANCYRSWRSSSKSSCFSASCLWHLAQPTQPCCNKPLACTNLLDPRPQRSLAEVHLNSVLLSRIWDWSGQRRETV